jgi:DNA-binding NtrC family response regulator
MTNLKKVLILDDEQDILNTLQRYFNRKNKVEIIIYSNPTQAVEAIKQNNFDLLLTDIMMPEMNGVEVLKTVKEVKPNLPVIMMTAYSTIDRILECEKLGADDYVTKPFISLKDVESKVLDFLSIV